MLKTDFTLDEVVVYLFCVYMLAMTGLYFHMDSRIRVLQTIQTNSLDMFRQYSTKSIQQQHDIDGLSGKIEVMKTKIETLNDNINEKLNRITNLILNDRGTSASKK